MSDNCVCISFRTGDTIFDTSHSEHKEMSMKTRLSQSDLLSIIAAAGIVTSATAAVAAPDSTAKTPALKVADKTKPAAGGKDSACGKGSCGTDEKGAEAAKNRDKKKADAKADATKAKADAKADATKAKAK